MVMGDHLKVRMTGLIGILPQHFHSSLYQWLRDEKRTAVKEEIKDELVLVTNFYKNEKAGRRRTHTIIKLESRK